MKRKQEVKEDRENGWGLLLAMGWEYKLDVKKDLHKLTVRQNKTVRLVILQTHAGKIILFLML